MQSISDIFKFLISQVTEWSYQLIILTTIIAAARHAMKHDKEGAMNCLMGGVFGLIIVLVVPVVLAMIRGAFK